MDQQATFTLRGLKTEFVGEAQTDVEVVKEVLHGDVQLCFVSPDSIINNPKYRKMLLSTTYKTKLVAVVVDETHCVKMWGDQFKMAFAQIGCVRSLVPKGVKIMALTATATQETLQVVTERLAMDNPLFLHTEPIFCAKYSLLSSWMS